MRRASWAGVILQGNYNQSGKSMILTQMSILHSEIGNGLHRG